MYFINSYDFNRQVQYPMYGGYDGFPEMTTMPGPDPLSKQVLTEVRPLVGYAGYEQQKEGASLSHTIYEVAAIAYLMGRGYPFTQARRIVESWEAGEHFPGFE